MFKLRTLLTTRDAYLKLVSAISVNKVFPQKLKQCFRFDTMCATCECIPVTPQMVQLNVSNIFMYCFYRKLDYMQFFFCHYSLSSTVLHLQRCSRLFIYPTNAQLDCSKRMLKLTLTFRSLTTYIYIYICRTAALTSRRYILNIYSTNIHTEYFKHAA